MALHVLQQFLDSTRPDAAKNATFTPIAQTIYMLTKIKEYKDLLERIKTTYPDIDKSVISKILVMANISEMVMHADVF
jgi:hypothetical protein